jgi:hypothetical protein
MSKLNEKFELLREQNQVNPNFRMMVDLQNFNQNEIPDSFLSSQALIFHLTERNLDTITTFNDIWSHILNPKHLELLTDLGPNAAQRLKKLDVEGESYGSNVERYVKIFEKSLKGDEDQGQDQI